MELLKIKNILVTGGAGYIGSHTVVELLNKDYNVIIFDNFQNSNPVVIDRIKKITNKSPMLYHGDLLIKSDIENIFKKYKINAVLHFAGLKSVKESVGNPLQYYTENFMTVLNLLKAMNEFNVYNLIFSSSATVYDSKNRMPVNEGDRLETNNPYGRTKLYTEKILEDLVASDKKWSISILRYFNPIGAHPSGYIGEDPTGIPNNLFPYLLNVAIGKVKELKVYGNDYDTPDGTGLRDYIHVTDLARGHIAALEQLHGGIDYFNMGTGSGYTVLEVINAFEKVSNIKIPFQIVNRREGDIGISYASVSYTREKLKWVAEKDIYEMCRDSWNWQTKNPNGYQ